MTGLNIPSSAQTVFDRMAVDVITELNDLDPWLRASFIRAMIAALSNAVFENYKTVEQLEKLTFWDTTEGDSLKRWATIFGINSNAATIATGNVTFTGVDQSAIPLNTQFSADSGELYQTTAAATIEDTTLSVSSLTRAGGVVTATTTTNHGLASNIKVTIAGAVESDYNGDFDIVVTGLTTFTYTISTTPTTPATGTITASAIYVNVSVESVETGDEQNLDSGASVSLSSALTGVDNTGYVSHVGVAGGTDAETDDSLRERFLFKVQNPISHFNKNDIINKAKTVSGVTRVFPQNSDDLLKTLTASSLTRDGDFALFDNGSSHNLEDGQIVTISGADQTEYNVFEKRIVVVDANKFGYVVAGTPTTPATGTITASVPVASLGQVKVYFTRDNDTSIIPDASEVSSVKLALQDIKPFTLSNADLIVSAPTAVPVAFTFTALSPNTTAMQTAITNNLTNFFKSGTQVAKDVRLVELESIINSSLDSGGNPVTSFTLSAPSADVTIDVNEIATLGTITYP